MEKKYMTPEELAEMLQVKPRTIRSWIKTKNLPVLRIGTTIRFEADMIEKWLKEQTEQN